MSKRPGEPAEAAALPGPRSLPGLGYRQQGLRMLLDPISFFVRMQRRYGDICSWARNNEKFINLYGPRFNRLVLENSDLFLIDAFRGHKIPAGSSFERLTLSLMRLNGDAHRRQRAVIMAALRELQLEKCHEDLDSSSLCQSLGTNSPLGRRVRGW